MKSLPHYPPWTFIYISSQPGLRFHWRFLPSFYITRQRATLFQMCPKFNTTIGTETSLVVQWLIYCTSTARGAGPVPGQGNKIPHAMWWDQNKKPGTAIKHDHKTSTDNTEKYSSSILDGGSPTVICTGQITWKGLCLWPGVGNSKAPTGAARMTTDLETRVQENGRRKKQSLFSLGHSMLRLYSPR